MYIFDIDFLQFPRYFHVLLDKITDLALFSRLVLWYIYKVELFCYVKNRCVYSDAANVTNMAEIIIHRLHVRMKT